MGPLRARKERLTVEEYILRVVPRISTGSVVQPMFTIKRDGSASGRVRGVLVSDLFSGDGPHVEPAQRFQDQEVDL